MADYGIKEGEKAVAYAGVGIAWDGFRFQDSLVADGNKYSTVEHALGVRKAILAGKKDLIPVILTAYTGFDVRKIVRPLDVPYKIWVKELRDYLPHILTNLVRKVFS